MPAAKRSASQPPSQAYKKTKAGAAGSSGAGLTKAQWSNWAKNKQQTKSKFVKKRSDAIKYHDAAHGRALAVPGIVGASVCLPNVSRFEVATQANTFFMIFTWTGSSVRNIAINPDRSRVPGSLAYLDSSAPQSIRPGTMSVTCRNATQHQSLEGSLRVLVLPQPLEWDFDASDGSKVSVDFFNELQAMCQSHPKTKTYPCASFVSGSGKRFVIPAGNLESYKMYSNYVVRTSLSDTNDVLTEAGRDCKMSTMIVQFPGGLATNQTLEFTIHSTDHGRYPANSMWSRLAQEPKQGNQQTFEQGQRDLQAQAGVAHTVGMDGLVATGGNATPLGSRFGLG